MSARLTSSSRSIGQVRIIGGLQGGRKIHFRCNDSGLRPSTDRARETLFNWLNPYLAGCHFLDAYAGSGVIGFEAVSRGAKMVTAIERKLPYYRQIVGNAQLLKLPPSQFQVIHAETLIWLEQQPLKAYHIIYLDPPFSTNLLQKSLSILSTKITKDCLICMEQPVSQAQQHPIKIIKQRQFGMSLLQVAKIS